MPFFFFFSILPSPWLAGTCLCQRGERRICTELVWAPRASLGSICFLVYLSPLQPPREDNLSDMPHLVYSRPLKKLEVQVVGWGGGGGERRAAHAGDREGTSGDV